MNVCYVNLKADNCHTVHRLNLFPLMHLNFFHMIFNLVAIAPLLERFESEFGTLVTLALFTGPFGTLPGGIYTLLEKFVFRANTIVMGARYAWSEMSIEVTNEG